MALRPDCLAKLNTCHPELIRLMIEVEKVRDLVILCGFRNEVDQGKAFAQRRSRLRWPNSRHNSTPSQAVDAVPFPIPAWKDLHSFREFVDIVKEVAKKIDVAIVCGADFPKLVDMPHFQLAIK